MPNAASPPGSDAEFDYRKAAGKKEDRFSLHGLYINRYVNRPLASPLVRLLFRTRATPNQVTVAAFVLSLAGAGFFFLGKPWSFLAGGILAQLSSIVDCADGMLARARGQSSEFGGTLDLVLDRTGELFLMGGAVIGDFLFRRATLFLILGLMAAAIYFLQTTLYYLIKAYEGDQRKGEVAENRGWLMALLLVFGAAVRFDIGILVLLAYAACASAYLIIRFLRMRGREPRPGVTGKA